MKRENPRGIYRWALSYLRPYRKELSLFLLITVAEILSGLLLPWPMKFIVDNALGSQPAPGWLASLTGLMSANRVALLMLGCAAYLFLHYASEFISVAHTQMQQSIGQRLIFDLRRQLFGHLQSLSLRDHLRRGPGETNRGTRIVVDQIPSRGVPEIRLAAKPIWTRLTPVSSVTCASTRMV